MNASMSSSSATPSALVARMAAGDEHALAALYDAYGNVAYALAFAITRAQEAAEAAVSRAFAEAWRSASSFDGTRSSVLAWLTAIVRGTALRTKPMPLPQPEPDDRKVWTTGVGPIGNAVGSLSSEKQRVIELSYYRGLTVAEIAAQLGKPESGARELLRSAMQELRTALGSDAGVAFDERVVTRA